jgi:hypothetical protein
MLRGIPAVLLSVLLLAGSITSSSLAAIGVGTGVGWNIPWIVTDRTSTSSTA